MPSYLGIRAPFSFTVADEQFKVSDDCLIGACICVAVTELGVAIRDTKDPDKTTLYFTHDEWSVFLSAIKHGGFNNR